MSDLLLNNKLILFYVITFLGVIAEVLEEAFKTFLKAKFKAIDNKIPLAPTENK
ncbi:MAG: hypothetical protein ACM31M_02825 [Nitrososphaerota archaeon]|jgi:hypothetical protein